MSKTNKTFLAVAILGIAAGGIIDFGGLNLDSRWTVVLPLGAVFFGVFMIALVLEKEMAKYDAEHAGENIPPNPTIP